MKTTLPVFTQPLKNLGGGGKGGRQDDNGHPENHNVENLKAITRRVLGNGDGGDHPCQQPE